MKTCKWYQAWIGLCKEASVGDSEYCQKHQKVCVSCGSVATHDCDETGQFVCGAPLCGECEHTIFPEGHNGGVGFNEMKTPEGMKRHCKKTEQKFKPWYAQESEKPNV